MATARTTAVSEPEAAASVDDAALLTRFARGDPKAFGAIVARFQEDVTRLAYRLLGWRHEVEDVVQNVFLSALQNLPAFRGESRLATWLYRITVNECRRIRRKQALRLRFWQDSDSDRHFDRGPAGPEASESRETLQKVRAAVRNLPAKYREVVVLRYLEELPILDIAVILGLSRNAVEVRLNRGRQQLKGLLGNLVEAE